MLKLLWNVFSFGVTVWMVQLLCHRIGVGSYGTSSATIALAGVALLAATVAAALISIGGALLKVNSLEERRDAFWLVGLLIPIGLGIAVFDVGKWLLLLVGIVNRDPNSKPAEFLLWLFQ